MRRREFVGLVGGAAAWPLAAGAQPPMPVIGLLHSRSLHDSKEMLSGLHQGLNDTGFFENQNVTIEYRWAEGQYERLPRLAADLVDRQVSVILAMGSIPAPLAAKAATSTIPIVFVAGGDPVRFGLVASLNRPGGNVTGINILSGALTAKRLELLRELVPQANIIACLINPANPEAESQLADLETAARTLAQEILVLKVSNEHELLTSFATLGRMQSRGLLVGNDALFVARRDQLVALAAQHSIPTIYFLREFATWGGLMSYGNSLTEAYYQVGLYTGRILKGEKPADLPVQQAAKVELIINLKIARLLGISVPESLLRRADEVIE